MAESAPLLRAYRVTSIEGSNPSLSAMLLKVLFGLGLAMFLSACDGEQTQEIAWQLPLSVPADPHASDKAKQLPEWATQTQGKATIVVLDKHTTRRFEVDLANGESKQHDGWRIVLQGLAQGLRIKDNTLINDANISNPAAFIALYHHDTMMYEGWLYQNFPELFGMDNSHWKVWVKAVTMPPPSQEGDHNNGSLSSAG